MVDTLYAVDIKLVDGTSSGGGDSSGDKESLRSLSDSWSRIERGMSSGRIGGMLGAASGLGDLALGVLTSPIGLAVGGAILTEIAANFMDEKIQQLTGWEDVGHSVRDWSAALAMGVYGVIVKAFKDTINGGGEKPLITIPNSADFLPNPTGTTAENLGAIGNAAGNGADIHQSKEQLRIATEIFDITKDNVTTMAESKRLKQLENDLNVENTRLLGLQNTYGVNMGEQIKRSSDLMNQISEAQKMVNFSTQSQKAAIESNNVSLEKQASIMVKIRKEQEKIANGGKSGKTSIQISPVGDYTLHTGATYSTTEQQVAGLKSSGLDNAQIINRILAGV